MNERSLKKSNEMQNYVDIYLLLNYLAVNKYLRTVASLWISLT